MRLWLLALVLFVAGCGAPPVARTTRTTPPTAPQLRAGTSGDYPPLSVWTDARPDGFAPALLGAFAASEGTDVRWTRFRWPELAADFAGGRFDLAADGITVRPERSVA